MRDKALAWWNMLQDFDDVYDLKKFDIVKRAAPAVLRKEGPHQNHLPQLQGPPTETVRDFLR